MAVRRKLPQVRFLNPASIEVGDTVRTTWKTGDIEHSRVGRIAKREYDNSMRVFLTHDGQELFRWHPEHDREIGENYGGIECVHRSELS